MHIGVKLGAFCAAFLFISTFQSLAGSLSLSFGTPPGYFLPEIQRDLVTRFFGSDPGEAGGYFTDPVAAGVAGRGGALRLTWRKDLTAPFYAEGALEFGQLRLDAPKGLGIFTDPARAVLRYGAVDLRLGGQWAPVAAWRDIARLDLTAGLAAARVEARLKSALLDVPGRSQVTTWRLGLGLDLSPWGAAPRRPTLRGEAARYGTGTSDLRLALRFAF